ncbi:Transcription factor [Wickerhamomyces ciferrii]|uniref:Transcription factor n=1 Tax=Wickerhamomyces ciferrii (strain ATCC 14091 / BCRC 22168 / CBS 111 / JCM 3599 / NBRC 0793 / NRRL Y-1031 F-60-10) TaxID=1206466 RepID=K0KRW2_WICCF|nr:Transcription factor [Wickerhamomyces ciferrii]CCH44069.1 Transcription factor [Wickerhamomyces ciferrii]
MSNSKATGSTEAILADHSSIDVSPAQVEENLRLIEDLKFFLATAPANWQKNQIIRRYYLNHDEGFVSCVLWNNLYFITGTDIVRCIVYRFEQFGREITDRKKFEEGIFSDLRSLKCGSDAVLEASKSPFLEFLYKNSCLRTQKKQKVFFWFSVPHDKLFADALERDLKKEIMSQNGTTRSKNEPSLSFQYDDSKPLYEQLVDHLENKKKLYASSDVSSISGDLISDQQLPQSSQTTEIEPSQIEPQTFYIKEEEDNQFNVIREDNDFPLDYFPIHESNEPVMIDPSVFINPPDVYNDQYLIDQTYAKTPYNEVTFDTDDTDDQFIPVSAYRPGLFPPPSHYYNTGVGAPNIPNLPNTNPYGPPPAQPQFITNGQFYDQQEEDGSFNDLSGIPDYPVQGMIPPSTTTNPYYAGYSAPPPPPSVTAAAFAAASAAAAAQHQQYYYDQQQQFAPQFPPQAHYYPRFVDEMNEDGDDELYTGFNGPPPPGQIRSPFSRGFPSFQAAAPPTSASRLRHQQFPPVNNNNNHSNRNKTSGKVSKPGRNSNSNPLSQSGLKKVEQDLQQKGKNSNGKERERESIGSSSRDLDNGATEDDVEYNSLPTPESTAPDPWHNFNSTASINHEQVEKIKLETTEQRDTSELNDFLEDKIYDEGDDKE